MAIKKNKYNARKVKYDGHIFDSQMECEFYQKLKRMKDVKAIELQPSFVLLASFKKMGKTIRPITYKADFRVTYQDGSVLIFDVKGVIARDFSLRKKLFDKAFPDLELKIAKGIWDRKSRSYLHFDIK